MSITHSSADHDYINARISAAVLIPDHGARVDHGLAVLDMAVRKLASTAPCLPTDEDRVFVELDADDLFDLVFVAMALNDPAARRVALAGLVKALEQPDFDALQISCLAVEQFCSGVERSHPAFH